LPIRTPKAAFEADRNPEEFVFSKRVGSISVISCPDFARCHAVMLPTMPPPIIAIVFFRIKFW